MEASSKIIMTYEQSNDVELNKRHKYLMYMLCTTKNNNTMSTEWGIINLGLPLDFDEYEASLTLGKEDPTTYQELPELHLSSVAKNRYQCFERDAPMVTL